MLTNEQKEALQAIDRAVTRMAAETASLMSAAGALRAAFDEEPVPTYALTADRDFINEGETVTFTLATTGVPEGSVFDYSLTGLFADDITGPLDGLMRVGADGTAKVSVEVVHDSSIEGQEVLTLTLPSLALQTAVLVHDLTATYDLVASPTAVDEGQSVSFTITTTNLEPGTLLPYRLVGVLPEDVSVPLSGNLTVGLDGTANLLVVTSADLTTEGDELMELQVLVADPPVRAASLVRDTSRTPAPVDRIEVFGPNIKSVPRGEANNFDNGKADYIDVSNLPGPVPWELYLGPDQELAPSRRGVESLGTWQRWHLYGHYNALYQPLPRLIDGKLPVNYPDAGSFPWSAVDALRKERRFLRYGPRGESIATPYTTWHGHTRRDGSTIHTSPALPMWIGITLHGHIQYAMRDGEIKLAGTVPVESWANDFSFYEPERKIFFYTDTGKGRVLRVDRRTNPWTITTLADGFGDCTSVRAVGDKVYVSDSVRHEVVELDGRTGARLRSWTLTNPFWISYFSNGDLAIMTRNRADHRINQITGAVGPNLTPGIASGYQEWVTVDVDRAGVMGEKDCFIALSVVGGANVDFYRYTQNGTLRMPTHSGGGQSVGPVKWVGDTWGHYPWVGAHHPDEAALLVQGMANAQPQVIVVCPPERKWTDMVNPDLYAGWLNKGRNIALYGDDVATTMLSRYTTFLPQMNSSGGGLVTADHVALWEPERIVAFLRGGMLGVQPRPFNKDQVKGWGMRTLMNSQQFLIEGFPLVRRFMDYCDKLPA